MIAADSVVAATQDWLAHIVVGMQLCPFAAKVLEDQQVRFSVSTAIDEQQLLSELSAELNILLGDDSIETSLLIHPAVLQDFIDFNDFLEVTDKLLNQLNLEGVFQIASFHPNYQFAGTEANAAENYTNRAPYPMLHILRERSVSQAIDSFTDIDLVPERNIAQMNKVGVEHMARLLLKYQSSGKTS